MNKFGKMDYEVKLDKLFQRKIGKDLIRWCIYLICLNKDKFDLHYVYRVCENGVELYQHFKDIYNLDEADERIVLLGCLMSKIGYHHDTKDYHLIGYGLVYENISRTAPDTFTIEEIRGVAKCVLEHRSDSKMPTTTLSCIVKVAHFGPPSLRKQCDEEVISYLSINENLVCPREEILETIYSKLVSRFGFDGYHFERYPKIGLQYYVDEWDEFRKVLYDKERVLSALNKIYDKHIG